MSVNEVKIRKASTPFEVRGTTSPSSPSNLPTSRTFVLGDEDHTLGNALRHVLINNAKVDFAGYCVPHPSEPVVHLRVQSAVPTSNGSNNKSGNGGTNSTEEDGDSSIPLTAIEALKEACLTLSDQCDFVLSKLEETLPEVRLDRERMERLKKADEEQDGTGVGEEADEMMNDDMEGEYGEYE